LLGTLLIRFIEKEVASRDDSKIEALLLEAMREYRQNTNSPRLHRDNAKLKKFVVDDSYRGPRIPSPITIEAIVDMIAHFKGGGILHYKYAHYIVSFAID
jgi:hypothetical protein